MLLMWVQICVKNLSKETLEDLKIEEVSECQLPGIKDNVILGVLHRHPNSNINNFNRELESVL